MKVSPCIYNADGELMAPRELDVKLASATPGGTPSKEEGFYHTFKFEARTKAELASKRRRFIEEMAPVPRCAVLSEREYTVRMDSFVRHGLDLLYVIETAEGPAAPQDPHWWLNRYNQVQVNVLPSTLN